MSLRAGRINKHQGPASESHVQKVCFFFLDHGKRESMEFLLIEDKDLVLWFLLHLEVVSGDVIELGDDG